MGDRQRPTLPVGPSTSWARTPDSLSGKSGGSTTPSCCPSVVAGGWFALAARTGPRRCPAANPPAGGGDHATPYHHIAIRLPGGGTVTLADPPDTRQGGFDLTCGLRLTKFTGPQPKSPALSPHDPLADLRASLRVPPTVRAGSTLTYVVTLTDPTARSISLTRCPSYVEYVQPVDGRPVLAKASYRLNCDPVGAIGAHQDVRFAMRFPVPPGTEPGSSRLRWDLIGPEVHASAPLEVTAPRAPPPSAS